jgi:hypothetical protein
MTQAERAARSPAWQPNALANGSRCPTTPFIRHRDRARSHPCHKERSRGQVRRYREEHLPLVDVKAEGASRDTSMP